MPENIPHYTARFDMSRDGILRALDESLNRHKLGHVDIVYLHDPDWENLEAQALATAFPTLRELQEQGVIKAFGTGMNQWEMMHRFMQEIALDVVLLAGRYTLLDQCALETFMPYCELHNTSVVVGGPYNSGILAADDLNDSVWFNYDKAPQEWLDKARRIRTICKQHGVSHKAAALQFPLAHPAVVSVIPGAADVAQLQENVALMSETIPPAFWRDLKAQDLLSEHTPTPS
jgi:D-threo-aldose 1-dehydrogenase